MDNSTMEIPQPAESYYDLPNDVKVTIDHSAAVSNVGLGIYIQEPKKAQTALVNSHGDTALANPSKNPTAMRFIALIMAEMRKLKWEYFEMTEAEKTESNKKNSRIGEKPLFDEIIKVETNRMLNDAEYPIEIPQTRHIKVIWKILARSWISVLATILILDTAISFRQPQRNSK